jgi:hypothetical protein
MKTRLAFVLLIAAAPAFADDPAPSAVPPEPAKTRPPLKLRLEDATPGGPRVPFTPREDAAKASPADTLPTLGGRPSPLFDQRGKPGAKNSPFPADTNPER